MFGERLKALLGGFIFDHLDDLPGGGRGCDIGLALFINSPARASAGSAFDTHGSEPSHGKCGTAARATTARGGTVRFAGI